MLETIEIMVQIGWIVKWHVLSLIVMGVVSAKLVDWYWTD